MLNIRGLFVTQQGMATGASLNVDLDEVDALEARVGADQPLTGKMVAGPAALAMAISFDFGMVAPAAPETVVVVTRLLANAPTGSGGGDTLDMAPVLSVVGPMPFRTELQLSIAMPRAGQVRIEVFDVRGRRLRRLVDGERPAGVHPVAWDGRDDDGRELGSGLFFVRLRSPAGLFRAISIACGSPGPPARNSPSSSLVRGLGSSTCSVLARGESR